MSRWSWGWKAIGDINWMSYMFQSDHYFMGNIYPPHSHNSKRKDYFLINQEKKSYQTTPKQGALPKYTGSIQRRPHPRQQRRNKNLEKSKMTNKSTTQHIHKREIVHVHELLRPFKKSPKEEIIQTHIWLLFFLKHSSIPLSPNTPKQTNRRHFPNYTPLLF